MEARVRVLVCVCVCVRGVLGFVQCVRRVCCVVCGVRCVVRGAWCVVCGVWCVVCVFLTWDVDFDPLEAQQQVTKCSSMQSCPTLSEPCPRF